MFTPDPDFFPVLFFTPGSRIRIRDGEKKGSRIRDKLQEYIFQSLENIFFGKNTLILCCDPDPGTGAFITLNPGCFHPGFAPLLNSICKNSSPLSLTSNKTSPPFRPLFRSCQDGEPGHSLTDCLKNVKYIRYRKLPVLNCQTLLA
jgi:hypothetical protein